ncbi:hypothetical protein KUTeg_008733 [Tegillarca granosa]|uniref:NADP-dependent oxidoreductase domain-containing protein n=1 Tax=Tegillarca granosa TaxID=220873 RepID=A0ABQ9FE93_TEGGR|nr:hypothetical protein KUTeg_008733 [Tegillarca granosa]
MEYEVLPACKAMGLGIFAYSPLQQGLLSGRFKSADDVPLGRKRGKLFSMEREICDKNNIQMAPAALSWILKQDGITCAIVGARTPEQVVENSKIIELSDSIVKELSAATEPVKNKIGKVLDQWAHPDRFWHYKLEIGRLGNGQIYGMADNITTIMILRNIM